MLRRHEPQTACRTRSEPRRGTRGRCPPTRGDFTTTGSGKSVLRRTEGRRAARARVDVINVEVKKQRRA